MGGSVDNVTTECSAHPPRSARRQASGEEPPQALFNLIINTRGIGDHGVYELQKWVQKQEHRGPGAGGGRETWGRPQSAKGAGEAGSMSVIDMHSGLRLRGRLS